MLTPADIDHIATLSHLTLTGDEKATYLSQLNDIIGHVEKLNTLNLDDIAPAEHAMVQPTPRQADTARQSGLDPLQNAPDTNGPCFQVPKIV